MDERTKKGEVGDSDPLLDLFNLDEQVGADKILPTDNAQQQSKKEELIPDKSENNIRVEFFSEQLASSDQDFDEPTTIPSLEVNSPPPPSKSSDAIDDALSMFADGNLEFDLPKPSSEPAPKPNELPPSVFQKNSAFEAPVVKKVEVNHFSEAAAPGPVKIEVPKEKSVARSKAPLIISLMTLVMIGGLGFFVFSKLKTEEGFLGFVLENGSLTKAYVTPTPEIIQEIQNTLNQIDALMERDDPTTLSAVPLVLWNILEKDSRNLEALSRLSEIYCRLMMWYGERSDYLSELEKVEQKKSTALAKLKVTADSLAWTRVEAWKKLLKHDYVGARDVLSSKILSATTVDEPSALLMAEIFEFNHQLKESQNWFDRLKNRSSERAQLLQAKLLKDPVLLEPLKIRRYLPAQVTFFESKNVDVSEDVKISQLESLKSAADPFPRYRTKIDQELASLYSKLGKNDKARETWKALVKQNPRYTEGWLSLAKSYEQNAEWSLAFEAYESAKKSGSLYGQAQEAYIELLLEHGKIVDALKELDVALKSTPKNESLLLSKSKAEISLQQMDAAKKTLESALLHHPESSAVLLELADYHIAHLNLVEAEAIVQKIKSSDPRYIDSRVRRAEIYRKQGSIQKWEQELRTAAFAEPLSTAAMLRWSAYAVLVEKSDDLEQIIKRAKDQKMALDKLAIFEARLWRSQRKYSEAQKSLELNVEKYKHELPYVLELATTLLEQRKSEEAQSMIKPFLDKEVKDSQLSFVYSKVLASSTVEGDQAFGNLELAERTLEPILRGKGVEPEVLVFAAQLSKQKEDRTKALDRIAELISQYPSLAEPYRLRGEIELEGGEYEKALKSYKLGLDKTKWKSLYYSPIAKAYKMIGQSALAIQFLEKATQTEPDNPTLWFELGKLYNDEAKFTLAQKALLKAVEREDRLPEAHSFLGFIYKEMGNKAAAIKHFEKALAQDPKGTGAKTIEDEIYFLKNGTR